MMNRKRLRHWNARITSEFHYIFVVSGKERKKFWILSIMIRSSQGDRTITPIDAEKCSTFLIKSPGNLTNVNGMYDKPQFYTTESVVNPGIVIGDKSA